MVLSVSSRDEVAVKLGRFFGRRSWGNDDPGTLARVSLAGGAARELLEDVTAADWDPEGRELAVVHERSRLEYPIGHVVCEAKGQMFSVRSVPGGRFVILEDQEGSPGRFVVSLVDRAGRRTPLSADWRFWWDVSWSQAGREVLFAAGRSDEYALNAVSLAGRERQVAGIPGDFGLYDVDPQGRILLERRVRRSSRWLYVRRARTRPLHEWGMPAWIDRIEVATGTRQPWKALMPGDPTGVYGIRGVRVTPDGNSYAYHFISSIGSLYLAEGLR
jgi:hypothetical protein